MSFWHPRVVIEIAEVKVLCHLDDMVLLFVILKDVSILLLRVKYECILICEDCLRS